MLQPRQELWPVVHPASSLRIDNVEQAGSKLDRKVHLFHILAPWFRQGLNVPVDPGERSLHSCAEDVQVVIERLLVLGQHRPGPLLERCIELWVVEQLLALAEMLVSDKDSTLPESTSQPRFQTQVWTMCTTCSHHQVLTTKSRLNVLRSISRYVPSCVFGE